MSAIEAKEISNILYHHGRASRLANGRETKIPLANVLAPPVSYMTHRNLVYVLDLSNGVRPDQVMRLDAVFDDRISRLRKKTTNCRFLMNPFAIVVPRIDPETVYFKDLAPTIHRSKRGTVKLTLGVYCDHSAYDNRKMSNFEIDLTDPETPHLLMAGTTGSGKSTNEVAAALSLAIASSPADVSMVFLDGKGMDFPPLTVLPHTIKCDMHNPIVILRQIIAEMNRRRSECNDDYRLIASAGERYPHIVVFMDELGILLENGRSDEALALQDIGQRGREMGIHIVGGVQKPSKSLIGSTTMANFPVRVCGAVSEQNEGYYATGVAGKMLGAHKLSGRGDFLLVRNGATVSPYQGPLIDKKSGESFRIAQSVNGWWGGASTNIVLPPPSDGNGSITVKSPSPVKAEREQKHNEIVKELTRRGDVHSVHGVTKMHREMFGTQLNFRTAEMLFERAQREMKRRDGSEKYQ